MIHRFGLWAIAPLALLSMAVTAQAASLQYTAVMDGPSESPANGSPGTGFGQVDIDTVAHTMRVQVSFSGLTGTTTASHIHAATAVAGTGTAGVATQTPTFTGFPLGVTSGSYDHTFDTTDTATWNSSFVTASGGTAAGAESALFSALAADNAYLNIHSSTFGGGEIRGFLVLVPEPASGAILGAGGLFAMGARRRRIR